MTRDTQRVMHIVSFIALTLWDIQTFEDISANHDLISNGGVFRTAPDTPGLLPIHSMRDRHLIKNKSYHKKKEFFPLI